MEQTPNENPASGRVAQTEGRRCGRLGCDKPHKAHGLCQSHYDRERADHRRNHLDRLVLTRARQRARQQLVQRHPDEFQELFKTERERALEQASRLGKVLLRPGRTAADQDEEDRVRLLEFACPRCALGHVAAASEDGCPLCGAALPDHLPGGSDA